MLNYNRLKERGDTLIEVLFATAAFSLIAVSGLSVMNQGSATAQRALEITLVRQEIDAQAETLRFLNSSYTAAYQQGASNYPNTPANEWQFIKAKAPVDAVISSSDNCNPAMNANSFILNTHSAKFVTPVGAGKPGQSKTFSQVTYNADDGIRSAEGIWIEAVSSNVNNTNNQSNAGYIDFNIRACWDSPGTSMPMTINTIVRLYEPRG